MYLRYFCDRIVENSIFPFFGSPSTGGFDFFLFFLDRGDLDYLLLWVDCCNLNYRFCLLISLPSCSNLDNPEVLLLFLLDLYLLSQLP